jgi:PadR family transcriptional regulator, regulatory protein PadR
MAEPAGAGTTFPAEPPSNTTMWFKSTAPAAPVLGDFEQLVLFGVLRLGADACGAAIRQEIVERARRDVSINAVYTTLDRLEGKQLLRSSIGDPTPERGGRRRKFYALTPAGTTALKQAYRSFAGMTAGFEAVLARR